MKKSALLMLVISGIVGSLSLSSALACTRAFQNSYPDYMITARNFDYFNPVSPTLVITPRGVARTGGEAENVAKWTSKYGSVVVYANDVFPMDGMNEKGLAGHTLYYTNGSQVQSDNLDKPVLESQAWLSYILDNFATVNEAVTAIKSDVRLVAKRLPIVYDTDTKHIAIEDVGGDSAIIQLNNGKVDIYHNRQYQVMTNEPSFPQQLANQKKYANATPAQVPGGLTSSDRFVRAAYDLKNLPQPDNKYQAQGFILSVINNVASPMGSPEEKKDSDDLFATYNQYNKHPEQNKGNGTYWTTISDLSHGEYQYKSAFATSFIQVTFKEINFSVGQPVLDIKNLNDYALNNWQGNILTKARTRK